jgi:hypothetical protein
MNKMIVTAVAAFVLGAGTTGVLLAQAQQAAPPMPPGAGGPPMGRAWMGQGPGQGAGQGQWGQRMHERQARRMEMMRVFALVDRAEVLSSVET